MALPPDLHPEDPNLAYLRRPNFRPIDKRHPVPTAAPSASSGAGCCFNRDYLPFFGAMFEIWQQNDFWEGDETEIQQAKDWMSELETMFMAGSCGKSGKPLFSSCDMSYAQELQDEFDSGGLDEVAPERPDTFFDEDSGDTGDEIQQRKDALCLACQDYVTQMMFDAFRSITETGIGVFSGGTVMTLVIGLPGALIVGAMGAVWGLSLSLLSQSSIRDAITCCMFNALSGVAITQANFQAALDGSCDVPLSPGGDAIHLFIKQTIQAEKNYLAFVNMMGSFHDVASAGIADCGCYIWEHQFLDGEGLGDWDITEYNPAFSPGTYDAGNDRVEGDCLASDGVGTRVEIAFASTLITGVDVSASWNSNRSTPGNATEIGITGDSDKFKVCGHGTGESNHVCSTGIINSTETSLSIRAFAGVTSCAGQYSRINKIVVKGRGTNPFLP